MTEAGQAVYSPFVLGVYDWYVLGLSATLIWRCPAKHMLDHYSRHVGRRHLDVGVGTGYFLDRAKFPSDAEITLLDMNPNSLNHAARRIDRYQPRRVQADVLEPNTLPREHYDSIGMSFLFHCLPDGGEGKWRALNHLTATLRPGGVLFGSTLLGDAPLRRQRWLMGVYNRKGIFSNTADTLDVLLRWCMARFRVVVRQCSGSGSVHLMALGHPERGHRVQDLTGNPRFDPLPA